MYFFSQFSTSQAYHAEVRQSQCLTRSVELFCFFRMIVVSFSEYGEAEKTWDSGTLSLYLSPDEVLFEYFQSFICVLFRLGKNNIDIGQSC